MPFTGGGRGPDFRDKFGDECGGLDDAPGLEKAWSMGRADRRRVGPPAMLRHEREPAIESCRIH